MAPSPWSLANSAQHCLGQPPPSLHTNFVWLVQPHQPDLEILDGRDQVLTFSLLHHQELQWGAEHTDLLEYNFKKLIFSLEKQFVDILEKYRKYTTISKKV